MNTLISSLLILLGFVSIPLLDSDITLCIFCVIAGICFFFTYCVNRKALMDICKEALLNDNKRKNGCHRRA